MREPMTDLSSAAIETAFERKGLPARSFRFFEETESTNDDALSWLMAEPPAPDGAFIAAGFQNRGRGRLGRSWQGAPGGALMFTYLFRPAAEQLSRVGMLGALAVCETIRALVDDETRCGIKWPNDVQLDRRKVCGVLPEAAWDGSALRGVALGIGLNVRQDFSGTAFEASAASLEPVLQMPIDRAALLAALVERLDHWRARIHTPILFERWRACLNMLSQPVQVNDASGVISGVAEGVEDNGALLIRLQNGALRRIIAGDLALG